MPLFYQQHINQYTQIAIWKIEEDENFFLQKVQPSYHIGNGQKRVQHLAAKHLLLTICPYFPIHQITISQHGKPFLPNTEFQFSISHTKNLAAVIVSTQQQVAIDIEYQHQKVLLIIDKFLSQKEKLEMLDLMKIKNLQQLPTILWCAKEAMFKYYATGNIDFKTMLNIQVNSLANNSLKTFINNGYTTIEVDVDYKLFTEFCVAYIAT